MFKEEAVAPAIKTVARWNNESAMDLDNETETLKT